MKKKRKSMLVYLRTQQRASDARDRDRSRRQPKLPQIFTGAARQAITGRAMEVLRDWNASAFEHEAMCRSGLRSALCLDGHGWQQSDQEAATVVRDALSLLGTQRPTFAEGQRDYVEPRENCAWCKNDLPDDAFTGHRSHRYCSDVCARSALQNRDFEHRSETDKTYAAAQRIVKRSRTLPRHCAVCSATFHPVREASTQSCCSQFCAARARAASKVWQPVSSQCDYCGASFMALTGQAKFCTVACRTMAQKKRKMGTVPTLLLPHVFDHYLTMPINAARPAWLTPERFDELVAA